MRFINYIISELCLRPCISSVTKKEHFPPICSSISRKVENIVQDLVFESLRKEHSPPICSSLSRSVFLLHLLTLSLASWITCQRCKGRVSPCDRKEQNSPSVTVPWIKNKNHTATFLFTIDTCHFQRKEQTYFFQVKNSTVYGYSPKILYCSMEIDITCCLNNQHFIKNNSSELSQPAVSLYTYNTAFPERKRFTQLCQVTCKI